MEQILEMITTYGLETVLIALLVNVLTGLVKMPIKSSSQPTPTERERLFRGILHTCSSWTKKRYAVSFSTR